MKAYRGSRGIVPVILNHDSYNCTHILRDPNYSFYLNEVIPLCTYIFTLLLYITVNTTTIEYKANAMCFDLQQSSSV